MNNFKFLILKRSINRSLLASLKLWRSGLKGLALSLPKGFTLIELLVYMGIFSLLLFVFVQLFATILDTHIDSQATSSVSQDGSFILARMGKDVRNSTAITIVSPTKLQVTDGTTTYVYLLSGTDLTLTDSIGTEHLNSINTKVTQFAVAKLTDGSGASNSVQVNLELTSLAIRRGGAQKETFETTIQAR